MQNGGPDRGKAYLAAVGQGTRRLGKLEDKTEERRRVHDLRFVSKQRYLSFIQKMLKTESFL